MGNEKYQMGYSDALLKVMAKRSAAYEAAHIAKFIRPGTTVLDVGCGPGSLTLDFAQLARPGQVTGLDINDEQFARPTADADKRGLDNIEFRCGSVYDLPFPEDSFDLVTENGVLMHLAEPQAAIAEMSRVLRPGGRIGLRDLYVSGSMIHGSAPCPIAGGFRRINTVMLKIHRRHGADFDAGIKHRGQLQAAGFGDIEIGLSPSVLASDKQWLAAKENAEASAQNWQRISSQAAELGLLTPDEARRYKAWQDGLRDDPAAVNIRTWLHASAQKPL